jgi:ethanolamine kinase
MGSTEAQTDLTPDFRYIPLSYSHADSQASALRLILTLNPDWEGPGNNIQFVRFTDGITNTVRLSHYRLQKTHIEPQEKRELLD